MKGRIVTVYMAIFISLLFSFDVFAVDILVSTPVSAKNINSAIATAKPGDTVIVPDGTYDGLNQIVVPSNIDGTEANPITLKAATAGGVIFTGNSASPLIFIQGDWWVIQDFQFVDVSEVGDANTTGILTRNATGTRVTNNYFEGFGVLTNPDKRSWPVSIGGSGTCNYSRVDHNTFTENEAQCISLGYEALHCQVDHNYFYHSLKDGSNGFEGIQVGSGGIYESIDLYTTIEYNLFENMNADTETISNKSSSNTYQYNVFKSTRGTTAYGLVLRGGDDCIVDGNYFFDVASQNIRVHGTGHKIINNYFENPGYAAILLCEGSINYAHVSDILIANNTIVDFAVRGIHIGWWSAGGTEPENLTFKNNIIKSSAGRLVRDEGHTGTFIWENNLHYATDGASYWVNDGGVNEPGAGIIKADPNLQQGKYIQRLQASSNYAINKGTRDINVTTDIDKNLRDASPDIGCDEFYGTTGRPISESEVGVSWLRQGTLKPPANLEAVMPE